MDVASLNLCAELYKLTGWDGVGRAWYDDRPYLQESAHCTVLEDRYTEGGTTLRLSPAYDVAFLLDKFEVKGAGYDLLLRCTQLPELGRTRWIAEHRGCSSEGDSPVDSVATLVIELFRRGVWGVAAA